MYWSAWYVYTKMSYSLYVWNKTFTEGDEYQKLGISWLLVWDQHEPWALRVFIAKLQAFEENQSLILIQMQSNPLIQMLAKWKQPPW